MNRYLPILNSRITEGLGSRRLTRSEVNALRGMGFKCSERWIVMQNGNDYCGVLYYPSRYESALGYENSGILVTLKERRSL